MPAGGRWTPDTTPDDEGRKHRLPTAIYRLPTARPSPVPPVPPAGQPGRAGGIQ